MCGAGGPRRLPFDFATEDVEVDQLGQQGRFHASHARSDYLQESRLRRDDLAPSSRHQLAPPRKGVRLGSK